MRNSLKHLRSLADDLMNEQLLVDPFIRNDVKTGQAVNDQVFVDVLLSRIYQQCKDYNEAVSLRERKSVNDQGSFSWYLERQANRIIRVTAIKARSLCVLACMTPAERKRAARPL